MLRLRSALVCTAVLIGGATGCNAIAGIEEPEPRKDAGTAPDGGIGESGSADAATDASTNELRDFIGIWTAEQTLADDLTGCNSAGPLPPRTDSYDVRPLPNSMLRGINRGTPSCEITLKVNGMVATLVPPLTCNFSGLVIKYTMATFTLTGDGEGTFVVSGEATTSSGDACTYTGKFVLKRGSGI